MTLWNFADVWHAVASALPDELAQIQGDRQFTWAETARRVQGLATTLSHAGLEHQDKVACYLFNAPEYLETAWAAFAAALVPVNTNYRYGPAELCYLWDDADVRAVVFHGVLTEQVDAVRSMGLDVRSWIHVDDGTVPCPNWAVPYERAVSAEPGLLPPHSGEDLLLIYTGGTTGRPKGVMWRQHEMYRVSDTAHDPPEADLAHVQERVRAATTRPIGLSAAPLMHGTGFVFATTILSRGGTLISQQERSFDAKHLLDLVSAHRISALCLVGEAFARPLVDALDADPARWDVTCLEAVSSAGMAWQEQTKQRLLRHAPDAVLIDLLNSSEASGMACSVTSKRRTGPSGTFRLGSNAVVLDDDDRPIDAGRSGVGRLAVRGLLPLGYYKDPDRTRRTFPVVDGVRYSLPGDLVSIDPEGTITLLGRGSTVINTGGEKVHPEEVEDALREHPRVRDVIVVGLPDERMGESVACLIDLSDVPVTEVLDAARTRVAAYKLPRHVVCGPVLRQPNGKPDYEAVRRRILDELANPVARQSER